MEKRIYKITRNNGESKNIANVTIHGDGQNFVIEIRNDVSASFGVKFVLDESEVHSLASMFNELSEIASMGLPLKD